MSDYLLHTEGAIEGTAAAVYERIQAVVLMTDQGDLTMVYLPRTKPLPANGDRIIAFWEIRRDVGFAPVVKFTDWKPTGPKEEWT